jgi:hypothetical protein
VESHLYRTLLKSKSIHESGLLPAYVKGGIKRNDGSPEELSATSNVTARLYNTKPVKEVMSQIMGSICDILGIQNPSTNTNNKNAQKRGSEGKDLIQAKSAEPNIEEDIGGGDSPSPAKNPGVFEAPLDLVTREPDPNSESELESDDLHDELLGDSSGEENAEIAYRATAIGQSDSKMGIPEQPSDASLSPSISQSSQSPSPPPRPGKSTKQAQQGSSKPGSTFLPTLMGGYWSGSESATDDEDTSTRKKNRPGQQARRALWEKKYGARANHLKGQATGKSRDKDWDPRRGARGADDKRFTRGRAGGKGGRGVFVKDREQSAGDNVIAVKPKARGMGKNDDAGPLHPSWEAAKKAKEAKQTASFQGKKVVFD